MNAYNLFKKTDTLVIIFDTRNYSFGLLIFNTEQHGNPLYFVGGCILN